MIIKLIRPWVIIILACSLFGSIGHADDAVNAFVTASHSPHPTQLTIKYGKEYYPVTGMKGWDAIINHKGKIRQIKTSYTYKPIRVPDYGPETIEISNLSYRGTQMKTVLNPEDTVDTNAKYGSHAGITEFSATMKSQRTLSGGFMILVLYSPLMFLESNGEELYPLDIFARELPVLPAGEEVTVKFNTKMPKVVPYQQYFVQVFDSEGREAMSNMTKGAWLYYSRLERKILSATIERYIERFAGKDHAAHPVVTIKPILPQAVSKPENPVTALLKVSAQGHVVDLSINERDNPELNDAISEALRGWLFLPRLKAGQPVETRVEVPIQF